MLSLLGLYSDRDRWCSRLSRLSSAYDLRNTVCFWWCMLLVFDAFGDLCFWCFMSWSLSLLFWCPMILVFSVMVSLFSDSGVSYYGLSFSLSLSLNPVLYVLVLFVLVL